MTKGIDETLNLPPMEELLEDSEGTTDFVEQSNQSKSLVETKSDQHDRESEEVRKKAIDAFDDIMDVGRNVNPERSARLFEVAGQFLKTGLDASNAKMEKQLKVAKLKLEAKRLKVDDETIDKLNHGAEIIADRNSLLKTLVRESENNTVEIEPNEENEGGES